MSRAVISSWDSSPVFDLIGFYPGDYNHGTAQIVFFCKNFQTVVLMMMWFVGFPVHSMIYIWKSLLSLYIPICVRFVYFAGFIWGVIL